MPTSTRGGQIIVEAAGSLQPCPGGIAIPSNLLLLEPRHLRSDDSRPGDLYARAGGSQAKDAALDLTLVTILTLKMAFYRLNGHFIA